MSISIVTVVLNAAEDLPLTLESICHQDYKDIELILVDGGSWDTTASVIERYAGVIDRIVHVEDAGIYHAMNAALDHCRDDYVLFLNSRDTLFSATTLSRVMACKEAADIDVLFGNHVYINAGREYLKKSIHFEVAMRALLKGQIDHKWLSQRPGHQATFVRTSLLRKLRFDTRIEICADHDVLMRAHASGASFQYIDETISHYHGGGFSAQRPDRLLLEWCSVYREYSTAPELVDRFFLGEEAEPTFSPQNSLRGSFVTGDYPSCAPIPERGIIKSVKWCKPDGVRLRTPVNNVSRAVQLEGFNQSPGQILTFFHDGNIIATLDLEEGWFNETVEFQVQVPPSSIIEISAFLSDEISDRDRRVVGFALASFSFEGWSDVELLKIGSEIRFSAPNAAMTRPMLGAGWSVQESVHVWTIGDTAELRLRLAPGVEEMVFRCKGNPFLENAQERGVHFEINGQDLGRHLLPTEPIDVVLPCPSTTRRGVTKITFRPILRRSGARDNRTLGVCLLSVACR